MSQVDYLKTIIYQLIGENPFLLETIDGVKEKSNWSCLEICIIHNRDCAGSSQYGTVYIGIPDIVDSYELSLKYRDVLINYDEFSLETKYSDFRSNDCVRNKVNVIIHSAVQALVSGELEKIDFLKKGRHSAFNSYAIYSLAYSIYHEIGHIIHDKFIECQNTREKAADYYAFEAIKYICKNNNDETNRLGGTIIGIFQMLFNRTPQEERDDKDHPHSIERLFLLLDFWNIPDDSSYWEFAYRFICIWFEKNILPITWERETSKSYKDKFIDAYIHFRKSGQS